ncbi:hypothetical protein GCM10010390_58580 [Streptomyces mordarskii]|uniref:Uncharacterized protein n=1 Tax=Streptomyces mordarskii TaxID=1226758 RepID=A0ABP3NMG5_9ACTN
MRHTVGSQVLAHRHACLARADDDYLSLFTQRSASTQAVAHPGVASTVLWVLPHEGSLGMAVVLSNRCFR